jgi:hypothetical protein
MFFRYAFEDINDFNGSDYSSVYPQYNVRDTSFNHGGLFSLSHTFRPTLFSNSNISFSRFNLNNTVANALALSTPELLVASAADIINGIPVQLPVRLRNSRAPASALWRPSERLAINA